MSGWWSWGVALLDWVLVDVEHLLVFPGRDVAEEVADDLRFEDLEDVRVMREALTGDDAGDVLDSGDEEWAVYVRTPDDPSYAERFEALVAELGGWYDPEPQSRD